MYQRGNDRLSKSMQEQMSRRRAGLSIMATHLKNMQAVPIHHSIKERKDKSSPHKIQGLIITQQPTGCASQPKTPNSSTAPSSSDACQRRGNDTTYCVFSGFICDQASLERENKSGGH